MPITLIPVSEKDIWTGSTWVIEDEDALAELIARVAIGQSRVVERILRATGASSPGYPKGGFDGARELLLVEPGCKPYHRDGWMFQVISWIAAHRRSLDDLIRAPHMIQADKGLDGLLVEFDVDEIARVVISEEKATKNPLKMVRSEVWPEFVDFESGRRDNELIASVTSLLATSDDPDPDETVANILWQNKRAYRVAVTVGDAHSTKQGRKILYKGYEAAVPGEVARRRAETLYVPDVRTWFAQIADKARAVIDAEEVKSNV